MSQAVYGLFIHGVGKQKPDFANYAQAQLNAGLQERGRALYAQSACWAPVLDELEKKMLQQVGKGGSDNGPIQRMLVEVAADALCYGHRLDAIFSHLDNAYARLRAPGPVHIFGHSLGALLAVEWLRARPSVQVGQLFTFGCNLQLFHLGNDDFRAPRQVCTVNQWVNLFDDDDGLGWPLRAWLPHVRDVEVSVGGWLSGWNAASHGAYFNSKKFWRKTVAGLII